MYVRYDDKGDRDKCTEPDKFVRLKLIALIDGGIP